jgi:hypothetical protein
VDFAYRELGPKTGVPVVFLTHPAAVLDNWDPRVIDGGGSSAAVGGEHLRSRDRRLGLMRAENLGKMIVRL